MTQQPSAFSIRWRWGSKPGIGRSVGETVERGGGREPDELGAGDLARGRGRRRRRARAAARAAARRSSRPAPRRRSSASPIARTPGSPLAPPSRICSAIARASLTVAGGASCRLKATSGGLAATSVAPPCGCIRAGPKSGVSAVLARSHPRGQPDDAAATQLRAGPRGGPIGAGTRQLAVEEDGQLAAPRRGGRRGPARRRTLRPCRSGADRRSERRRARRRADAGRCAPRPRPARLTTSIRSSATRAPRSERVHQRVGTPREREHRAVVVGVGVDVEHAHALRQRRPRRRSRSPRSSRRRAPRTRSAPRAGSVASSRHEANVKDRRAPCG